MPVYGFRNLRASENIQNSVIAFQMKSASLPNGERCFGYFKYIRNCLVFYVGFAFWLVLISHYIPKTALAFFVVVSAMFSIVVSKTKDSFSPIKGM